MTKWRWRMAGMVAATLVGLALAPAADASCGAPANAVVAENCKPGTSPSIWQIPGSGDASIQGFATQMSVAQGDAVGFKIKTNASDYRLDIYRLGWYGGDGARLVDTVQPSAFPVQPACLEDSGTGLVDCGDWQLSASWRVPPDAVSGIYIAHLVSAGGESHVPFVVRDDARRSDVLFQTSDTTWQAYNTYGGNSLYVGGPAGRAYKVSYNRPLVTRGADGGQDYLFNAEYPMVRWLERNGYDVSYFSGVDSDRLGAEIREHRVFLSVGHDEYWSGDQRANVVAARDSGVNLAFFSGNEVFWKTRWEDDHRTLVSYKETHENRRTDPTGIWTGSWRDPRFGAAAEGVMPENALTGTIFSVNSGTAAIKVPAAEGKLRLWRGAGLAPGTDATLTAGTLGYEWDEDLDNGYRPPGLVRLSSTTVNVPEQLQDYGSTYAPGTATHSLTLYRDTNGAGPDALVFGAGTVQWPWGLDDTHDRGSAPASPAMQQATTNVFADMGVQPGSLTDGSPASASTDKLPPSATITSPARITVNKGTAETVTGTAVDAGGGRVGAVEVSVDGGASWHPADGRERWSYTWTPAASGTVTPSARAADDSANLVAQDGSPPPSGPGSRSAGKGRRASGLRIRPRRVRASRKGVVRLRVSCPSGRACRVRLRLWLKGHTVARKTLTVKGGKSRSFALKLNRATRRRLLRKRHLRVTAVASMSHNERTLVTRVSIRLQAPKRTAKHR